MQPTLDLSVPGFNSTLTDFAFLRPLRTSARGAPPGGNTSTACPGSASSSAGLAAASRAAASCSSLGITETRNLGGKVKALRTFRLVQPVHHILA